MFKTTKPFLKYVKPYYFNYIECFLILIVVNIISLSYPFMSKFIIDDALPNKNINLLIILIILMIGVNVVKNALSLAVNFFYVFTSQKVYYNIQMDFIDHLIHLPQRFFDDTKVGEISNRINDVGYITTIFDTIFFDFFVDFFMLIINLAAALYINPILTLITLLSTPLFYFYSRIMGKIQKEREKVSWDKRKELNSNIIESFTGMRTIKALASENTITRKFRVKYLDLRHYTLGTRLIMSAGSIVNDFLNNFSNAIVFFVGMLFVINGEITLGDWFAYNSISRLIISPLLKFTQVYQKIKASSSGVDRLIEVLNMNIEERKTNSSFQVNKGNITFKDVNFSYNDKIDVLNKINVEIKSGETVAFVGRSGSGKTTISNLLLLFYSSKSGEILIDDINIKEYDLKKLRKDIGIVLQDPFIFNGTIKDNLTFGVPKFSRGDLINACKMANALEFIEKLPDGFNTMVGERGSTLSGGQKQRLSIARIFLKDPKILIFDEATSNLDNESERIVQEAAKTLMKGRTTIIIAHRLSTIIDANKICVLDKGKICEIGTHQELLEKGGIYSMLYDENSSEKINFPI